MIKINTLELCISKYFCLLDDKHTYFLPSFFSFIYFFNQIITNNFCLFEAPQIVCEVFLCFIILKEEVNEFSESNFNKK